MTGFEQLLGSYSFISNMDPDVAHQQQVEVCPVHKLIHDYSCNTKMYGYYFCGQWIQSLALYKSTILKKILLSFNRYTYRKIPK